MRHLGGGDDRFNGDLQCQADCLRASQRIASRIQDLVINLVIRTFGNHNHVLSAGVHGDYRAGCRHLDAVQVAGIHTTGIQGCREEIPVVIHADSANKSGGCTNKRRSGSLIG